MRLLLYFVLVMVVLAGGVFRPKILIAQPSCTANAVLYSTVIGDELEENGNDLAVDSMGRAYIGGTTFSNNFPTTRQQHGVDAVALALNSTGATLDAAIWANPPTFNAEDEGFAVAVDAAGNRYFAGRTGSTDFCDALGTNLPGYDTTYNGNDDGFLVKIDANHTVVSCSYIGGDQFDWVRAIAVSPSGDLYLTGGTWSDENGAVPFPVTTTVSHAGQRDVFIMKFDADGSLAYSTLLGGSGQEEGLGVAVNEAGEAHVTGWSNSADFPTSTTSPNGDFDAFAVKLSADGSVRRYVAAIGGASEDRAYAIDLDASGNAYVVGTTRSADFPTTTNAFQSGYAGVGFGGYDAFITKLASSGDQILYSTYVGRADEERAHDVVVSGSDVYVTGFTKSAEFPTTLGAFQTTRNGLQDAFLLRFRYDQLWFSSFWGGSNEEIGNSLVVQGEAVFVLGDSRSADFCTTPNAYDTTPNGDYDIFFTKFDFSTHETFLPIAFKPD